MIPREARDGTAEVIPREARDGLMRAWIALLQERHPGVKWIDAAKQNSLYRPDNTAEQAPVEARRAYPSHHMELVFGAGKLKERRVANVERLLRSWRVEEKDWGQLYLEYNSVTPPDRLLVEDLAVTMLINSRVAARAATSVCRNGHTLDLASLPDKTLEETTDAERQSVAEGIGTVANWPWLGASTATKTLHKKRPGLIPILDNMAIFGAYMNSSWPETPALADTVNAVPRIKEALDWIAADLTHPANEAVWKQLHKIEPERTRIELFDMVWWMYFSPRRAGELPLTKD